ncbi:hypothetical protein [Sediminibacter sp. Hel_I_10]|nr:hypothetical protein [Sediminibacter sp. Hel_I_10]
MEITVNINMVGLEQGNVKTMSDFLTAIESFNAKVIVNIDSNSMSIGRVK